MGYTTDFKGSFTVTPPLTKEQTAYLQRFNATRRMKRDPVIAAKVPDPDRLAVGLPIGPQAAYFVGYWGDGNLGQTRDESVIDYNCPPGHQPGLWCQWTPTDDGSAIEWDGGEKFYNYVEWLAYLIDHFLELWDRKITGEVHWQGEDSNDRGTIYAKSNRIQAVYDTITRGAPSWAYDQDV